MPECANQYEQLLEQLPVKFMDEVPLRLFQSDAWLAMMTRKPWLVGSGDTLTTVHTEPTIPSDVTTWTPIQDSNDSGNNQSCSPDGAIVPMASTKRTVTLEQKALDSEDICYIKTLQAFQFQRQLINNVRNFEEVIRRVQSLRIQERYSYLAGNKVIVNQNRTTTGSGEAWSTEAPTSQLTQSFLDHYYDALLNGRGIEGAFGTSDGSPVFLLLTDRMTSNRIRLNDPDIREDFRYADPRELLKPLGVKYSYKGFAHAPLREQRRFDIVDGQWVERYKLVAAPASTGNKAVLNPLWENAEYGESYIFHKDAVTMHYLSDGNTLGAGTKFDPQSFMGELKFIKYYSTPGCVVDGDVGLFRARMIFGYEPNYPELGFAFRHKLCPNDIGLIDCSYSG